MRAAWMVPACLSLIVACSRASSSPDAGTDAQASAPPDAATSLAAPVEERREALTGQAPAVEAQRTRVTKVDADGALAANADVLKKQFGGAIPAGLAVQTVLLPQVRRRALLVADEGKTGTAQEQPIVLVVDQANTVLWARERPAAGITPPIGPIALAAGPKGRLALAVCDPPTSIVALRLWDADGSPFADFPALEMEACETVSLLYWPRHGWVVAASRADGTRAQLVTEGGMLAWGRGVPVGARWRIASPVSLAADTDDTFMLVQYAGAKDAPDHGYAYRYDERGAPLWPAAVDLGEVPRVAPGRERIVLSRDVPGVVRASLGAGRLVEIASSGELLRPR